ncbi:MAG: cytochrome D ubiquinol oxidase subunit I [Alphaproteobacteria bacterium]|nr:cytochrome D ubiquinol oxidase subunit I [Alphaproteobacteria bacterium]
MAEDEPSLDPADWDELRALGHRMVDDMFDYVQGIRERPVWQRFPEAGRAELRDALPRTPARAVDVYEDFRRLVLPYATGNVHPRFMGWVHGGGNVVGMLAELLAGGLNANLGGRDHAPILVERQVIGWAAEMLGLPAETSGLLVTGTSMANMIAVLVARTATLGPAVRQAGLGDSRLIAYASTAAHSCIPRAMDMAGLGTDALRLILCDRAYRMDLAALSEALRRDRDNGAQPFLVIATAGSVDTGAIDDLAAIARVCREHGTWFHVDAAFGALAALSPALRPLLTGIEQADSVAFDFHKWAQVPYDAGCILVRDPARHLATFSQQAAYLRREARGLAGGSPWPCDLGPDLSRGFRALKVWMTLRTFGADRLGEVVAHCCAVARALAARVEREPALELLAPVALNIVCFRYRAAAGDLDELNTAIVADLQEAGIAAPSTTVLAGCVAIRAAIVNHRTTTADAEAVVGAVLRAGAARTQANRGALCAASPSQARTPAASPNASATRSPNPPTERA